MRDRLCPRCSGDGLLPAITVDATGAVVWRAGLVACPRCAGTGRVRMSGPERLLAWRMRAEMILEGTA